MLRSKKPAALALSVVLLSACGGGSSGGGGTPPSLQADDARRAVLADLGQNLILPRLREFATQAQALSEATAAWAGASADTELQAAAQQAWQLAQEGFQRLEVLAVGPLAMSSSVAGEDRRELIYAYPRRNDCVVDRAAYNADAVNEQTRIDAMGLGALEHLLFAQGASQDCPPEEGVNVPNARAQYADAVAQFIAQQADVLRDRWEPEQGDFLSAWSEAGLSGSPYMRPQDALDALSVALFYVEKEGKDRKIACPTGIGASGLSCTGNDPSRSEWALSGESASALRANIETFRDAFRGRNGGMGLSDLLRGIERDDIAERIELRLDETLQLLATIADDFEGAVAQIDDNSACLNASSTRQGPPDACALHGRLKAAMDIFRSEVVAALSLATPDRAAGDND